MKRRGSIGWEATFLTCGNVLGMYFAISPFLNPFHNFLLGYELAESCHGVERQDFKMGGFAEWLNSVKGLDQNLNRGWPGMIEAVEDDKILQLKLAIDYFAEYAGIPLLDRRLGLRNH